MSLNEKEELEVDSALSSTKRLKVSAGVFETTDIDLTEGSSSASNSLASPSINDAPSNINEIGGERIRYRLRIENVSKYANAKAIKNLLAKHGCGTLQVKKSLNWDYCYVPLKSKEQQLEIIEKLKDVVFKNKLIVVKADNITEQERQKLFNVRKNENFPGINEDRSPEEMLADQITPLHRLPYSEQLKSKEDVIKNALSRFSEKIKELYKDRHQPKWIAEESESNLPFEVHPIIPSPILEGYRNKCEFTIGKDLKEEKTVGYLLGAFKDGFNVVLGPEKSLNSSEVSKKIAIAMQEYVRRSDLDVYDRMTRQDFRNQF